VADAVGDAAVNLTVDNHRIDQPAGILNRDVAENAHASGFGVDLYLGHMASVRVCELVDTKCGAGFEARLDIFRKRIAGRTLKDACQVAKLHRKLRRADNAHSAIGDFEVLLGGLKLMARELTRFGSNGGGGDHHGRTGRDRLPAGETAEAERRCRRVAGDNRDILRAHTEDLCADLRERRAEPLPHRRRAGRYRDLPGRRDADIAEFERAAAGALHAMRQPDADIAALRARDRLTAREILPLRGANYFGLAAGIVAAVLLHLLAGARFQRFEIRHLFRRAQIAAA